MFVVSPNSLNYGDVVEKIERDHECEVVNIAEAEDDSEKHKAALQEKIEEIKKISTSSILANAPKDLNECYLLRNNQVIPSRVIFLHDNFENMVNFYHKVKSKDIETASFLAENELK